MGCNRCLESGRGHGNPPWLRCLELWLNASRVLLVNPARIAYTEWRDVTPPYLKWIEERFPKSAQAFFPEFLPPLIIAYSPLSYWRFITFAPSRLGAEFWLLLAIFCPKKAKRYQMRYQIFPPLSELKSGAPARN
jgi:hypothetical protein